MPHIIPDRPLFVILEDSLSLSMYRRHHDTSALLSEAYPAGNDSEIKCTFKLQLLCKSLICKSNTLSINYKENIMYLH